jgi:hypothetical protein
MVNRRSSDTGWLRFFPPCFVVAMIAGFVIAIKNMMDFMDEKV